jgi:branched-chain amino acid transport system permease protein
MSTDTNVADLSSTGARHGDNRPGMLERPLSRMLRPDTGASRLRARPELYTAYAQDMALLNTRGKQTGAGIGLIIAVVAPFLLGNDWVLLLSGAMVFAIGAIGLNIITGYAGQVSLGHAFFVGLGAYTAAAMSGDPDGSLMGLGITFVPLWLLAAGVVSAVAGALVAPIALRLKGLYLAIVTLGLVLLGEHIFKEASGITGGPGVGRQGTVSTFFGGRFDVDGAMFGVEMTRSQKVYLLVLVVLVVLGVIARNVGRSDLGRAFSAVRDRDIAAEVIGVDLTRAKVLAFVIGSFYAGVAGALLVTVNEFFDPGSFNLLLSIRFIAMILIGGVATISGAVMGAVFIALLPRISFELVEHLPEAAGLSPSVVEGLLYGTLLIGFLIVEPRGLFGLWFRIRNYWKAWPFSY